MPATEYNAKQKDFLERFKEFYSQELLDGLKAKAENPDFIVNQSWEKIIDIAYIENIRSLAYESI